MKKNTPDLPMLALGKRLLANPHFPADQPSGCLRDSDGWQWVPSDEADWNAGGSGFQVPDLSDPSTVGCLLALVREVWDPATHVAPIYDGHPSVHVGWRVWPSGDLSKWYEGTTEAAALVSALEAG